MQTGGGGEGGELRLESPMPHLTRNEAIASH